MRIHNIPKRGYHQSMQEKLKKHFLAFGPRRFVIFAVLLLVTLDALSGYYLKLYWMKLNLSQNLVLKILEAKGMSANEFNVETVNEVIQLANNAFYFFLYIILFNNLFFYFFYLRKKLWAQGYVLVYTLTAAILNVTLLFDDTNLGVHWWAYNFGTIFVYLYLYLGVKSLREETTIPAHGKKGQ